MIRLRDLALICLGMGFGYLSAWLIAQAAKAWTAFLEA